MSRFSRAIEQRDNLINAETVGRVADSQEVRVQLLKQVEAGELTLDEAQLKLKRIKRTATREGKITRTQASHGA